jgi:hypothetical protein
MEHHFGQSFKANRQLERAYLYHHLAFVKPC